MKHLLLTTLLLSGCTAWREANYRPDNIGPYFYENQQKCIEKGQDLTERFYNGWPSPKPHYTCTYNLFKKKTMLKFTYYRNTNFHCHAKYSDHGPKRTRHEHPYGQEHPYIGILVDCSY